jgi:hypothetical protein
MAAEIKAAPTLSARAILKKRIRTGASPVQLPSDASKGDREPTQERHFSGYRHGRPYTLESVHWCYTSRIDAERSIRNYGRARGLRQAE